MALRPLVLSVKCLNWRMHDKDSGAADAAFEVIRKRALERDHYTCQFCGFKCTTWQEVHHADDDHQNNSLENLITTCPFCHNVQHIGLAGRNGEAVLAYIPHISQERLHHIVRTAIVAQRAADMAMSDVKSNTTHLKIFREAADISKNVLASLRSREAAAEKILGTSDPAELGTALLTLPDEVYAKRSSFLAGIRLLPLGIRKKGTEDIMKKHVDAWLAPGGPYANLKPMTWVGIFQSVAQ